jgi:hypothetical protein
MKTDQSSVIKLLPSIDPAVIYAANGTKTGATIDSAGYESLTFGIQTGVLTDGTLTSAVYGSAASDMTGEVQLTGNQLIGTDPTFAITDDSTVKRVGVNIAACPTYRYYRQKVTQAAASTGGYICGHAVLGNPRFAPVA